MSKGPMIPKERATEIVEEFLDSYEIDLEEDLEEEEDEDGKKVDPAKLARQTMKKLTKAVMSGRLEFEEDSDDNGMVAVQHLKTKVGDVSSLRWEGITGQAKTVLKDLDNKKDSSFAKVYKLTAVLTGTSDVTVRKLKNLDLSTAEVLTTLFLQV